MNIFQDLRHKIEKGFEQAGSKSQRVFEMSRLNLKAKNKKDNIDELMKQLGWAVYQSWKPGQKLKETDGISKAWKAVDELSQEIDSMEEELNRLKTSNITTRTSAETVTIPLTSSEDEAPKQTIDVNTPPKVIYLCPNCAYQVTKNVSQCPHCNRKYY